MRNLLDLTDKTPEEWDTVITHELREAHIDAHKFRDHDTPHYWVKQSLEGRIGGWIFSRDTSIYSFWGDVPLATAEAIANDPECAGGCIPRQWFPNWGDIPDHAAEHARYQEFISWIEDGCVRAKDDFGDKEYLRTLYQKEANWKLKLVDDPSAAGKPFIRTYTFFTLPALKNFVEIARRHRVEFVYTP